MPVTIPLQLLQAQAHGAKPVRRFALRQWFGHKGGRLTHRPRSVTNGAYLPFYFLTTRRFVAETYVVVSMLVTRTAAAGLRARSRRQRHAVGNVR